MKYTRNPEPGQTYVHFKGGVYSVLCRAKDAESADPPTDLVVYSTPPRPRSTQTTWVRPVSRWVEDVVWPDGVTRPRFVLQAEVPTEGH